MITGEKTSFLSSPPPHRKKKNIVRTSESCKAVNNTSLTHEDASLSWVLSVYLIGYFQDILCRQANKCETLNCKRIWTLCQIASTQLYNIYTHTVKKNMNTSESDFIIQSAAPPIIATMLQVLHQLPQAPTSCLPLNRKVWLHKYSAKVYKADSRAASP